MRGGASPEIEQVSFEQSLDGINYTPLGHGTRISGGWQLTGLSLPPGQNFCVRARGRAVGGIANGSSGLIECVKQFYLLSSRAMPRMVPGNGAFQFQFRNMNDTRFYVLATTNTLLPVANWQAIGSPINLGGGFYQFTDLSATNYPCRFYQLKLAE